MFFNKGKEVQWVILGKNAERRFLNINAESSFAQIVIRNHSARADFLKYIHRIRFDGRPVTFSFV